MFSIFGFFNKGAKNKRLPEEEIRINSHTSKVLEQGNVLKFEHNNRKYILMQEDTFYQFMKRQKTAK